MAGNSMPPSGSARPSRGRGRGKFLLFSTVFLVGLGFFGGVTATKYAMKGPALVQRLFGLETPPAAQPVPAPSKAISPVAPPVAPATNAAPPVDKPVASTPSSPVPPTHPTSPPSPSDEQGFLGLWEITDEVQLGEAAPTNILSAYIFNADGTGEFDTNGKKMYDLRWNISGDFLTLTYDTEQAPQGDNGAIRMRWSVTPDKTLLTLVPENGKDARATLYNVGPGVYHKK